MSAWLWMLACGGDPYAEEHVAGTLAEAYCARQKDCARGDYEAVYFGAADCRRQNEVLYDALVDSFSGCAYDAGQAEEAVDRLYQLDCGDFYDEAYVADYAEIWTGCSGGGGGGGPVDTGVTGS